MKPFDSKVNKIYFDTKVEKKYSNRYRKKSSEYDIRVSTIKKYVVACLVTENILACNVSCYEIRSSK